MMIVIRPVFIFIIGNLPPPLCRSSLQWQTFSNVHNVKTESFDISDSWVWYVEIYIIGTVTEISPRPPHGSATDSK